jgi:hypothetical protein
MALPLLAGAFGANLLAGLIGTSGARKRSRRLRQMQLAALSPLEALLSQSEFGPSEAEGGLMRTVESRTLRDLAGRGVLNSSISAPAVAQAVAPIEERRQARRQGLAERLAAARQAIYASTEAPGYEEAFAGTLGEFGGLLALLGGEQFGGQAGMGKASVDVESVTPPRPAQPRGLEDLYDPYQ